MIQRIQTVYLAIVTALSVTLFFVPLSVSLSNTGPGNTEVADMLRLCSITKSSKVAFGEDNYSEKTGTPWLLIGLNSAVGVVSLITLFLYNNRKKQMLWCRINLVLICLLTGAIFWMEDSIKNELAGKTTYLAGTYIPVIQLILTYLAERAVKKDEALVRSADRLR